MGIMLFGENDVDHGIEATAAFDFQLQCITVLKRDDQTIGWHIQPKNMSVKWIRLIVIVDLEDGLAVIFFGEEIGSINMAK